MNLKQFKDGKCYCLKFGKPVLDIFPACPLRHNRLCYDETLVAFMCLAKIYQRQHHENKGLQQDNQDMENSPD